MGKKIAVIHDLSGFGKCSLTAAIPVLSVMGVQACPFPTAVLTAQTGYPSYYCEDFTDKMERFRQEWEKMNVTFDGIYTGYVACEQQIDNIFDFIDIFKRDSTFLITDPVMGDHGKVYGMYSDVLLSKMKQLVSKANIVTPNLTELCLLEGENYEDLLEIKDEKSLMKKTEGMARNLLEKGPNAVVVTGIIITHKTEKQAWIFNLCVSDHGTKILSYPYGGESYSGTGDLFASVITGGITRGDTLEESMELAGNFIMKSIQTSSKDPVHYNDGIEFEQHLKILLPNK